MTVANTQIATSVWLSSKDLAFLSNAIGEALEAAKNESEFKLRTGASYERASEIRADVKSVLGKLEKRPSPIIDSRDDVKKIQLPIGFDDLRFLCTAVSVTLAEVEEWEFNTRTGGTPEEARTVLAYLQKTLMDACGEP
jgi:hypothetical protein